MEIYQQLLHGGLAPWTSAFKSRRFQKILSRIIPENNENAGKSFIQGLSVIVKHLGSEKEIPMLRECNFLYTIPKVDVLSEMMCDLLNKFAPPTPRQRYYYLLMGYTTERWLACIYSKRLNDTDRNNYNDFAIQSFRKLAAYREESLEMQHRMPECSTTLIYLDLFMAFAQQIISMSLKQMGHPVNIPISDQLPFSKSFATAALPPVIDNTRKGLSGLLILTEQFFYLDNVRRNIKTDKTGERALMMQQGMETLKSEWTKLSQEFHRNIDQNIYMRGNDICQRYDISLSKIKRWRLTSRLHHCRKPFNVFEYQEAEIVKLLLGRES